MIRRILDWFRRDNAVSTQWRHEHAQRDGREGFDGPNWHAPTMGVANEPAMVKRA